MSDLGRNGSPQFYVGYRPCGCCTAFMRTDIGTERQQRAELKRWVRSGYRIEIVSDLDAQPNFMDCPHEGSTADDIDALIELGRGGDDA